MTHGRVEVTLPTCTSDCQLGEKDLRLDPGGRHRLRERPGQENRNPPLRSADNSRCLPALKSSAATYAFVLGFQQAAFDRVSVSMTKLGTSLAQQTPMRSVEHAANLYLATTCGEHLSRACALSGWLSTSVPAPFLLLTVMCSIAVLPLRGDSGAQSHRGGDPPWTSSAVERYRIALRFFPKSLDKFNSFRTCPPFPARGCQASGHPCRFSALYFDTALSSSPAALPSLKAFAGIGYILFGTDNSGPRTADVECHDRGRTRPSITANGVNICGCSAIPNHSWCPTHACTLNNHISIFGATVSTVSPCVPARALAGESVCGMKVPGKPRLARKFVPLSTQLDSFFYVRHRG